jgi:hypothetical protein
MAELGRYNNLTIIRRVDIGLYVDGDELGQILLPRKYVTESMQPGEQLELFVYNDSEDRIVATTLKPALQVGECAYLRVVGTSRYGAFMDWGLPKDLLVPFGEQQKPMQKGYSYMVYAFVDEATQRIAGSTRLEQHLSLQASHYRAGQAVNLQIYGNSDLGFKAVVDGQYLGQLYANETFQHLHFGESLPGFIKRMRSDGRIDLTLSQPSQEQRDLLSDAIIEHLRQHDGVTRLTDKSAPDDIYRTFGVSKANYKKALGRLYKRQQILIEKHQITLL